MSFDPDTRAAVEYMLVGKGTARTGQFIVTVHGGRIVSVQDVERKVPAQELAQPTAPKPPQAPFNKPRSER
jgi:hypothetical protein